MNIKMFHPNVIFLFTFSFPVVMTLNTISSYALFQFGDHLNHPHQLHSLTKLFENILSKRKSKKPIELSVVRKEPSQTEPFPQHRPHRISMSSSMHSFDRTNSDAFDIDPPPPYQHQAVGGSGRMFAPDSHYNTTRGMEVFLTICFII